MFHHYSPCGVDMQIRALVGVSHVIHKAKAKILTSILNF